MAGAEEGPQAHKPEPTPAPPGALAPAEPASRAGLIPRLAERLFDFFLAPGRRAVDHGRANLNVKLVVALIGCLTLGWKFINAQQAAYERLVDRMVEQFALQHRETIKALERLEQTEVEMAREQRANTETVREAFLVEQARKTAKGK